MDHKHKLKMLQQQKRMHHVQIVNQMVKDSHAQTAETMAAQAAAIDAAAEDEVDGDAQGEHLTGVARTEWLRRRMHKRKFMAKQAWIQFAGSSGGMGR